MSEQNQNPLPPPPEEHAVNEQFQHLPPPPEAMAQEEATRQGRIGALYSRLNERYDAWLDRQVERNPQMEKGRLSVVTGVIGGVAVLASVKFGPEFAEHVVSAFGDERTLADGAALSVTAGAAYAVGMNRLDRHRARKQTK
ncbi:hypothetical protein KC951_02525 [Candidatus Saccharibacteria bacterium]|nr:hypothetical protein [Candidatus Saccharibacteria bacterium]